MIDRNSDPNVFDYFNDFNDTLRWLKMREQSEYNDVLIQRLTEGNEDYLRKQREKRDDRRAS